MTDDEKFILIKQKIIKEMVDLAPITFIDYSFSEKKLVCMWHKINKKIYVEKEKLVYNSQNPSECIFVSDYQDRLWKCFHMLEILYIDYIIGEPLQENNYLMSDEDAIQYVKKRYEEHSNV